MVTLQCGPLNLIGEIATHAEPYGPQLPGFSRRYNDLRNGVPLHEKANRSLRKWEQVQSGILTPPLTGSIIYAARAAKDETVASGLRCHPLSP